VFQPPHNKTTSAASVELSGNDLAEIKAAVADITVQGERYPAQMQQRINR
jgi:hypothetical protein